MMMMILFNHKNTYLKHALTRNKNINITSYQYSIGHRWIRYTLQSLIYKLITRVVYLFLNKFIRSVNIYKRGI